MINLKLFSTKVVKCCRTCNRIYWLIWLLVA